MNVVEQVQRAKTPREAMLILAAAVDELRAAQPAVDPWESWGDEPVPAGRAIDVLRENDVAPPAPLKLTEADVRSWIEANYGRALGDDAEARAVIAQVKRDLERSTDARVAEDLFRQTSGVVESAIDFAPQDEAHRALREKFANDVLQLDVALGPSTDEQGRSWAQLYAQGGPMWLYIPNRDLLMQYPDQVKAAMVADVARYSAKVAHEMSADILKQPLQKDERSPAMAISESSMVPDGEG